MKKACELGAPAGTFSTQDQSRCARVSSWEQVFTSTLCSFFDSTLHACQPTSG